MLPIKRITIDITPENIWFVERYLNVFDFADLFPVDAFGGESGRGVPVVLHTDHGFDIVTDIDRAKWQLRNRSRHHGWMRWTAESKLAAGDRIVLEKTTDREYRLGIEKREA